MKVGDDELLTLADASARIGLTTSDLRAQASKGRLHAEHMGRNWVVFASELDRYAREVKGKRGRKPAPQPRP